jgi:hypothetical protein
MNKNSLTTAVIAGLAGVAGIANMASAVDLNPDGLGQVLLYPYYTVNNDQNTLLSVVNTTNVGKAVKVRFLEGYNSREVLDFNLFLSPFDVWTATVFPLATATGGSTDAGPGAIASFDNSCTAPQFTQGTISGVGYQQFLNYAYTGSNADTGPTDLERTREGHFEMITMSDIIDGSDLSDDTTHIAGVPPGCGGGSGGKTQAEIDFETGLDTTIPTSGIFGSAAILNAAQGTFYSYNADAIDGFTAVKLDNPTGSLFPTLASVNDAGAPNTVTSLVFNNGVLLTSSWLQATQAIDAVSSVFDAANIYNQYETSSNGSVSTDWVVNFPTKRFYVDADTFGLTTVIEPFEHLFGADEPGNAPGLSCVVVGITIFDREENTTTPTGCGFSPCPPGQPPSSICHETNVITFDTTGTASILDSGLTANIKPIGNAGWTNLTLTGNGHDMRPANNLNQFHGLPITGFEATNFVNGSVGSSGVLSNYSGVFRHRQSRNCTNGVGACS